MTHPAELAAMEKKAVGFLSVLPWLIMATPFATQLIDKIRGGQRAPGDDPFKRLQVRPKTRLSRFGRHGQSMPAITQEAQRLHQYRAGF